VIRTYLKIVLSHDCMNFCVWQGARAWGIPKAVFPMRAQQSPGAKIHATLLGTAFSALPPPCGQAQNSLCHGQTNFEIGSNTNEITNMRFVPVEPTLRRLLAGINPALLGKHVNGISTFVLEFFFFCSFFYTYSYSIR